MARRNPASVPAKISKAIKKSRSMKAFTPVVDSFERRLLLTTYSVPSVATPTIQSAINASSAGDSINVAAGTYTEQLTINKSLTITGQGKGNTTIKSPSTLSADSNGSRNIVAITGSFTTVDLGSLTVAGPDGSGAASIDAGIFVSGGATASIHDDAISNIGHNPFAGDQTGIAIQVGRAAFSTTGSATISNTTISSYQKGGIVVDGTNSSATIQGNTITGAGPTSVIAQNGVQISRGALGSVSNNVISANQFSGNTGDFAAGVLLFQSANNTTISTNTISNNDAGINDSGGTTTTILSSNTISGYSAGIFGVYNSSTGQTTINGNTISGYPNGTGIYSTSTGSTTINSNTIDSNQVGIDSDSSGSTTINGNNLGSTAPNPAAGIEVDQGTVAASNNTIMGGSIGLYAVSFDGNVVVNLNGTTIKNATTGIGIDSSQSSYSSTVNVDTTSSSPATLVTSTVSGAHGVVLVGPASQIVESVAPTVTIDPNSPVISANQNGTYNASFTFSGRDNVTSPNDLTYQYQLDGGSAAATTSPLVLNNLSSGTHTLKLTVFDQGGLSSSVTTSFTNMASNVPAIGDFGFETIVVGNSFLYNPSGSAWTFSGSPGNGSGVTGNNSPFTSGNPNAPQGVQVAFLQSYGTITQSVTGFAAGNYTLSFNAAKRGNNGGNEDFQVLIDNAVVGTFSPTSTAYQNLTTSTFAVSAGAHSIKFLGLDTVGGDNTAFIDNVSIALSNAAPAPPTPGDSGFEAVMVGGGFAYNPTGSAWTFSGSNGNGSGVAGNNSPFTSANPPAPQGTQVAFIQNNGTITQTVSGFVAGSYTVSFFSARRGNNGGNYGGNEDFQVLIDGVIVGTIAPTSTSYQTYTTGTFTVSAGSHVIKFVGLDSVGGDNTAFIDAVSFAASNAAPAPPTPGDAGFEVIPIGPGTYAYNPSGSSWTFSGGLDNGSGISGNNSPFTSGNPNAPQGQQVAFLQDFGSITQSVPGFAAGNYTISFDAARRGNNGGNQNFQVLVDNNVVGTFAPATTSYQVYTTMTFTVSAGAHTIKFLGLDTAGGDNTDFIDAVSIANA